MTQQRTAEKTAAEARADEIAGFATTLGHSVSRVADPAEGTFEVIVRGRYETLQVVVRQSKFPSRSAVWSQRFNNDAGLTKARRVPAGEIRSAITAMTTVPATAEAGDEPGADDRITFKYLNADHRVHEVSGVELLRIGGIWHVKAPGDEPRTGGNPDHMIDNVMPYAHTVVRGTLIMRAAAALGVEPHELSVEDRDAAAAGHLASLVPGPVDGFAIGDVVQWAGAGHAAARLWKIRTLHVPTEGDREPYAGLDLLDDPGPGKTSTAGSLRLLRKVEPAAAAASCAAVLAVRSSHRGQVGPYLFSDGPLGEHIEYLCEVHGACTTARPATAADVERLAGVEAPGPELLGENGSGFAVALHPSAGGSIVADAEPSAATRTIVVDGKGAAEMALTEAYARIYALYADRPDRSALALALGVLRDLGAAEIDFVQVELPPAVPTLAALVEAGRVPANLGDTGTKVRYEGPAADAATAVLAELGFTRPQPTRYAHPSGAELVLLGFKWKARGFGEQGPAQLGEGPRLAELLPAVTEWIDAQGPTKINIPAPTAPAADAELDAIQQQNDAIETELAALRAAVELHRPALLNKHAQPTNDPADAKWIRCNACHESVPANGCETWRAAHPQ